MFKNKAELEIWSVTISTIAVWKCNTENMHAAIAVWKYSTENVIPVLHVPLDI
jgi:hypothetical protein